MSAENKFEIISISEARVLGLKRYYTGKECPSGHVSQRMVSNSTCVTCQKIRANKWAKNNPEKIKKFTRDCMRNQYSDPEKRKKINARSALWRENNKDKYKSIKKNYRKNNKLKKCIDQHRRRARLKLAGGDYTEKQIIDLLFKQKRRCMDCLCDISNNFQIDHLMPIALGGNNYIDNIQLLCRPCNSKKQAQDPFVWARKNGRLF